MKGLLGWHGGHGADPAAALRAMRAATPQDAGIVSTFIDVTPLDSAPSPDVPAAYRERGLVAAISGRPFWKDNETSSVAKRSGNHAALAQLYRQHGDACVRHIGGHFSLALVDTEKNLALLAIDRIGAYPLCYALTTDGALVFGSTTDVVKAHPNVAATVSHQALYDYLYFHMIPSPGSIYAEIKKLEPAQCLRFESGKIQLSHYWQPAFVDHGDVNIEALEKEFLEIVRNAVRRCDPDETTGAFLSGGTDSSTVSGMLAGLQPHPAKTYSIGFAQEGYDEISYARIASKHFKTDQHEYYVTPQDVAAAFSTIACAYDEPFGNSSAIPTYFCAQLAKRDGTNTLLAGDGGDELFGGNARYAKQKVFGAYERLPQFLRRGILEPLFVGSVLAQALPPTRKIRSYIEQARMRMPDRMESYNFLQRTDRNKMFDPEFLLKIDAEHPINMLREVYDRAPSKDLLNRMLFLDWKTTLADNDLRKVNRMCALSGVEVRYPMLDDDLLEFSARVPPELKLKGLKLRYFFKKSLENFLPHEILNKSKHGFGLPFGEWLKSSPELQEVVYSSLRAFKSRHILRPEFIDELITTHLDGHAAYYGTLIWVLAMLEQWFQEHDVKS